MHPATRATDQPPGQAADYADKGAATAETAVAMPLLLGLILVIVQFGVWAHTMHVAHATATEQLSLPLVLLFAGFLLLIGFPAVTQILGGF